MTAAELVAALTIDVKSLSSLLTTDNYYSAINDAVRETGHSLPSTNATELFWLKKRSLRHLLWSLCMDTSQKFRIKQIYLQHKFEHLLKLVEMLDKEYEEALDSLVTIGVDPIQLFGTRLDSGFSYDQWGVDTTYDDSNQVIITPSSTDTSSYGTGEVTIPTPEEG